MNNQFKQEVLRAILNLLVNNSLIDDYWSVKGKIPSGMCFYIFEATEKVSPEKYIGKALEFEEWFHKQKPSEILHKEFYYNMEGEKQKAWWWPKGEVKPRIEFLKYLIRILD